MASALLATGEVTLANVGFGQVSRVTRADCCEITQWAVPARLTFDAERRDGLPAEKDLQEVLSAIDEFSPDIVHVWGAESFWGLLNARGLVRCTSLLDMQGLKSAVADVYHGGLSLAEQVRCIGARELVRGLTPWQMRRRFAHWARFEREIVRGHRYVTVQSRWMEAVVRDIAPEARIFRNDLVLRDEFYAAEPWRVATHPRIFCSAAYSAPFKGLHVAVRAVARLKKRFPNVELRIAGARPGRGMRRDGYLTWVAREVERLRIDANVVWLGPLAAAGIVQELRACAAVVIPTYIENCCTALNEAMMVGAPAVVSYVGGIPSVATDEYSALMTSSGDSVMLAAQVERLLRDSALASTISTRAREVAAIRNDREKIARQQLMTYAELCEPQSGQELVRTTGDANA